MTARHFRGGEPVRLRDGRVVTIRAIVVAPDERLRCTTESGEPVDVPWSAVRWEPAAREWVEVG